ncbi:MAG: hypothetical protein J5709_04570 [Bacteroidales bacterium]|nr:hypothetical protein [Bacteroidales bacterium]
MKVEDIINRQLEWAKRKEMKTVKDFPLKRKGIESVKDYPLYCSSVYENIFDGLHENTVVQYDKADGNELKDGRYPAKMKALFSSSALCVNLFQYFADGNGKNGAKELLIACNLITPECNEKIIIEFEKKFETGISTPNVDVVIRIGESQLIAIESKFTEPYSKHDKKKFNFIQGKYGCKDFWKNAGNLFSKLGFDTEPMKTIQYTERGKKKEIKGWPIFNKNLYLDTAQLIKHILGVTNTYDDIEGKTKITLVYLWYDAFGAEGKKHREEIEEFCKFINENASDKVLVMHATYQEVIANLSKKLDYSEHKEYIDYITERYL